MKVIVTGATGMVGEGVLLECLRHPEVEKVLMVNRKPFALKHAKLAECVVSDFMELDGSSDALSGYDACFYGAGISSVGMSEADYTRITYDITMHFARKLESLNPKMIFDFVSGNQTDSSEKGKIMWARVKGRTENALMRMNFQNVYNFRPGFMKPTEGQRNVKGHYKVVGAMYPLLHFLFPKLGNTLSELGLAMINSVLTGYPKQVLEVPDIRALSYG